MGTEENEVGELATPPPVEAAGKGEYPKIGFILSLIAGVLILIAGILFTVGGAFGGSMPYQPYLMIRQGSG